MPKSQNGQEAEQAAAWMKSVARNRIDNGFGVCQPDLPDSPLQSPKEVFP